MAITKDYYLSTGVRNWIWDRKEDIIFAGDWKRLKNALFWKAIDRLSVIREKRREKNTKTEDIWGKRRRMKHIKISQKNTKILQLLRSVFK